MFNKALDEGSLNSQIEPLPDLSPLRAKLDEFDAPGSRLGSISNGKSSLLASYATC